MKLRSEQRTNEELGGAYGGTFYRLHHPRHLGYADVYVGFPIQIAHDAAVVEGRTDAIDGDGSEMLEHIAALPTDTPVAYVAWLYVTELRRGRGVGGRRLDVALDWLAERGIKFVYAHSVAAEEDDKIKLLHFYFEHGFENLSEDALADAYSLVREL